MSSQSSSESDSRQGQLTARAATAASVREEQLFSFSFFRVGQEEAREAMKESVTPVQKERLSDVMGGRTGLVDGMQMEGCGDDEEEEEEEAEEEVDAEME